MAVTEAALTSGWSDTDASSYATASITPTGNLLLLAAVFASKTGGSGIPTLSGNGVTWVQVATLLQDTARRVTLFRGMVSSPSAGAVTIDFGGVNQLRCGWSIAEFAGINTGGTNGSAAVVQSATNTATATTSLTVTLAAFGDAGNATYGFFAIDGILLSLVPGAGFSSIHTVTSPGENSAILTEWRNDNDTTVNASNTDAANWGGIAIEIAAAVAGGVTVTPTTVALTLTTFVPTIRLGPKVTPTMLALSLSTFVPTVRIGTVVVPPTATLSLATFAPTVSTPRLVTPSVVSLTLSPFAPTVRLGIIVTPSKVSLTLSAFAPAVAATNNQLVTPLTLALTLTAFAPTVTASSPFTPFGNLTVEIDGSKLGGHTVYFEAHIKTTVGAKLAQARLFNVTDSAAVPNSTVTTASTSPVRVRSSAITLPAAAKTYRAEFGGAAGAAYTCYASRLVVTV